MTWIRPTTPPAIRPRSSRCPDLTIHKTHTGSFLQGQVGATYTVTVTNIGGGPTTSPLTVSDTLPAGLTPTAAAGAGWVCNIAGQSVSCTRGDALNVGASHPAITVTVNVAPAAPPSLTNTAQVSGRRRDQYGQQHGRRRHHDRARPRPDHHQEPLGQLHPGTDGGHLHHHGKQPRLSADHRRRDGH